jgi:hypothetical protein
MLRKLLLLTATVSVFTALNLQAAQIPVSWGGGGNYNDWDNANNWEPNIVPNNGTDTYAVTINAGTGEVCVGLRLRSTIDQLDCYGEVELIMGPHDWQNEPVKLILVDPNSLTNHGYLAIVGFQIEGNVTNTAGTTLELEDMEIEGDLYNQAGATIEVFEVSDEVLVEGDVENAGSITITPVSKLNVRSTLHNTGQVQLFNACCMSEELFHNDSNGVIQGFGVVFADQLQNKGKIYAYGGSLAIACEGPLTNTGVLANHPLSSLHIKTAVDVNNLGTIEVNAGGGVAFDCNLVNKPNGIIKLLGGTLAATSITQTADANFVGFGGITGNVIIDPNGLIELISPTNIVGDVTVEQNAVLEISNGQTLIVGHTTNNGEIRVVNGDAVFQGGYSGSGIVKKE